MTDSKWAVLCVDDDEDTCDLLRVVLSAYDVSVATTAADGARLISHKAFDLYLFDNMLADGSGLDICRKLRELDPNAPVVFLSGAGQQDDLEAGLGAGAQAYLVKPVALWELESIATNLVRQAETRNEQAMKLEPAVLREAIEERLKSLEFTGTVSDGHRAAQPQDEVVKAAAFARFAAGGGTRAGFERFWPALRNELGALTT